MTRPDAFVLILGASQVELGAVSHGRLLPDSVTSTAVAVDDTADPAGHPLGAALRRLASMVPPISAGESRALRTRATLSTLVSDRWMASTTLPWSDAIASSLEGAGYARMFLAAAGRRIQQGDVVVVDDAPPLQPRLAVAYSHEIMSNLAALAAGLGAELVSILPLSAAAWQSVAHGTSENALAIAEDGALTIAHGAGRLTGVSSRAADAPAGEPGAETSALLGQWRRMQMRDPTLSAAGPLKVLDLRARPGTAQHAGEWGAGSLRLTLPAIEGAEACSPALRLALTARPRLAIDGVPTRRRSSATQRALVLVALGAAVVASFAAWRSFDTTEQLRTTLLDRERSRPAPVQGWRPEQLPQVRAVNAAITDLNMPVLDLVSRLAPPRDLAVSIVSVDVPVSAATRGEVERSVKIVADAESADDMTRYVSFVAQRKRLSKTHLSRHDLAASGKLPYRFTIEAAWTP